MNETQALVIIRTHLLAALQVYGYVDTQVFAGRQPTKQTLVDNSVYLFSIGEERQATQGRHYTKLDPVQTGDVGHIERVRVRKTIQVQAFYKNDYADLQDFTATDLCATVKMIFDSLPFQEAVRLQDVATHNTTPIREPEFINDAGDYEKNPSFDFDLGFTREIKPITPAIEDLTAVANGI